MATMSAADRRKYREHQKLKQSYATGSPANPHIISNPPSRPRGSSSAQGSPQLNARLNAQVAVLESSGPRRPPSKYPPPAKKPKVGPSYEFGLPLQGEPTFDVMRKQVLQSQKRIDGQPDSRVHSVFGARYHLNQVLSNAACPRDVARVQSLGLRETMTAVKSYGHYIFVLTHLAEDALSKIVADHGRLERDLKRTEEAFNGYKLERTRLQGDLEKY